MPPLGPVAAFPPALARTRLLLFHPFRIGRTWKKSFWGYLALGGSVFLPFPLCLGLLPLPASAPTALRVGLWAGALVATLVFFGLYYLGSRMQFVLFDLVLQPQENALAPLWRLRSRPLILRWIAFKLLVTLPLGALLFAPLFVLGRHFFSEFLAHLPQTPLPGQPPAPPDPALFALLFTFELVLAASFSAFLFCGSLLTDVVLPSFALHAPSIRQAVRRASGMVFAHPAAFAAFFGFKAVVALGGIIAQYTVSTVAAFLAAIPLALLGLAGWLALHTVVSPEALIAAGVALYFVFAAVMLYFQLESLGILQVFLRAYSLIFLGGYDPLLADLLYPPPPLPLTLRDSPAEEL